MSVVSVRSTLKWRLRSVPMFRNRLLLLTLLGVPGGSAPEKRRPMAGRRAPFTGVGSLS